MFSSWLSIALAAVLVVSFGWWLIWGRHQADPVVVEGWATPSSSGTAIGLSAEPGGEEDGYVIVGAIWSDGASWHEGTDLPTCIGDDPTVSTRVRMGVVPVNNGQDRPSPADTVVWIECLPG